MFLMITPQQPPQYHFVNIIKTWTDALSFCREKYTDLATAASMDNQNAMIAAVDSGVSGAVWIGLENTGTMTWQWSVGTGPMTVAYWDTGEPNNSGGNQACGMMNPDGFWNDATCTCQLNIMCYKRLSSGVESYNVVLGQFTWRNGQNYCRTYYTDLASVTSLPVQQRIATVAGGVAVWIGLFRDTWSWSIGSRSSFRIWQTGQPDNSGGNDGRVTVVMNPNGQLGYWDDRSGSDSLPFLCFSGLKVKKRSVKLKMSSAADLCDPAVRDQLLEQMQAVLVQHGVSDFNLTWRIVEEKKK